MCAHPKQSGMDAADTTSMNYCYDDTVRLLNGTKKNRGRSYSYGAISKRMEKEKEAAAAASAVKKAPSSGSGAPHEGDVPDGGWGWLVVLGVALSNMTTQALVSVFGFLFSQRLRELSIETSGAALILSVQSSVMNLSGLYTGALIRAYSYQKVAMSGALLMVTGLLLTVLADSLTTYILTYSIFTGLGLGFLYPSTFVAVNTYFSTKKGIAVGWSVTGTGVGQMLLPLLVSYLLEEYGFQGTILILAAVSGHSLVAAMLYQPVAWHLKPRKKMTPTVKHVTVVLDPAAECVPEAGTMRAVADNCAASVHGLAIRRLSEPRNRSSASLYSIELDENDCPKFATKTNDNQKETSKTDTPIKEGWCSRVMNTLDYDLLKSVPFLIVVIGCGVVYTANTLFQMLYPLFLESLMYTRKEVASCMVTLSAFDIVGRPVLPYIVRIFKTRAKTIFFISALVSAIVRSGLAAQTQMLPILILSAVCGLVRSAIITNMNLSVAEQTSRMKLPAALGLQMVSKGLASMALGPLIGIIRDETQSYSLCIHVLSVFFLFLPFLAYLLERLCSKSS